MSKLILKKENKFVTAEASSLSSELFPLQSEFLENKRHLTESELVLLQQNRNTAENWQNIFVPNGENLFDVNLVRSCDFSGTVVLGVLRAATLKYHDLELDCGLYNSRISNTVIGDDCVVRNVAYLDNYCIKNRVMLFNVQEMSCTHHSKFGNGILKEGEPESNRIWIGVSNENDDRAVLPFESMIPADVFLWSRYRDDADLMRRFLEITEYGNTRKLDTFGIVEDDVVIKNTTLIKDAKIGARTYIKGAFKLKNITVLSSEEEASQIGEGVEMVNGIMGYGSRVFYQAVAVRFVIGRNCHLKYGARLLNSVLGDNSTVSCCELLNNLIFPFHEQHHNSSFLIATTIMGQSNIAAGATIGSNHNSRSPDGEIVASRGFWPGLCSDFKHNSYFAPFVLISKGSYQYELNITYPFSLVASGGTDVPVNIVPAFWFLSNMFAIARNNDKFKKRDKRIVKIQHIETDPLAPDTMQDILKSLSRIIELTARYLQKENYLPVIRAQTEQERLQFAKDFLHKNQSEDFSLVDDRSQKKYGAVILKPALGYREYRRVVKYFAARTLIEYCHARKIDALSEDVLARLAKQQLFTEWQNVGGQIIPTELVLELFEKIKSRQIETWQQVHDFYDECQARYDLYKARYAIFLFEELYSQPMRDFSSEIYADIISDVLVVSNRMYAASIESRSKDFLDYFRTITYRNEAEMTAVIGTIDDNEFLHNMKDSTEKFNNDLKQVFGELATISH